MGLIHVVASLGLAACSARPNILMILTDDQSQMLDDLAHMPKTNEHLARAGATVLNMYAATPVCCPSRASIYTGRYIHNLGVTNNSAGAGGCASLAWQTGPERYNVAWLLSSRAGYTTAFAGKYLNNYGFGSMNASVFALPQCANASACRGAAGMDDCCASPLSHVPRGWSEWHGLQGNSVYYNYSLSVDGRKVEHGDDYAEDYLVDKVANATLGFVERWAAAARGGAAGAAARPPFFAVAAVPAAHEPADPAPQHADYAAGLLAPRTPTWNVPATGEGRHWMVDRVNWDGRPMNATVVSFVDLLWRRRLAALQSVDEMVGRLVKALDDARALDETYIFYTTDNGYHLGQFAIPLDKRQPYQTDVRLPLLVRGPGIAPGRVVTDGFVVTIDLAPTFLDLAGVAPREYADDVTLDGRSAAPLLLEPSHAARAPQPSAPPRDDFLIEYHGEAGDNCHAYLQHSHPRGNFSKGDGINCGLRGPDSWATPPYFDGDVTFSTIQDAANNTYACVRTLRARGEDTQYCEWTSGEVELYDLAADQWNANNLARAMTPDERSRRHARLVELRACAGDRECANARSL